MENLLRLIDDNQMIIRALQSGDMRGAAQGPKLAGPESAAVEIERLRELNEQHHALLRIDQAFHRVRWYLTYRLSYRALVEMMAELGVTLSHSTILRWVQRYVPEFERRLGRFARPVHTSWRMDETAVSVRGGANY
jgi:hypothetical protein